MHLEGRTLLKSVFAENSAFYFSVSVSELAAQLRVLAHGGVITAAGSGIAI